MDRERPRLNLGKLIHSRVHRKPSKYSTGHCFFALFQLSCRHQLILEEIPDWSTVELVVNGEMVFRCNINDLDFGGDGKLDPLCEEARKAALNAY
ncbi:UPF0728 protein C10orf53 homolog [Morphnus guianensis]